MRWVPSAAARPHRCAFIPFIGGAHPEGFFDFGTEIMAFDGHAYCSVKAAQMMAEAMGWQPGQTKNPLEQRVKELEAENAALREEIEGKAQQLAAVHLLKREGFTASRKPGRPKTKVA